ncbi:MAG: PD40 domain-containing protein [Candidatus Eremiobacteraeota bacterium]|nr:PD40 domain-containing protein [Candidatus Eremiobacteraeota bacterium]MCW5870785.1 PD40 domain-containing protein [Candidatus Eremiobacteraeota bacterium]
MEIAFDSQFGRGPVDHPPIAYASDGVWTRSAGQEPRQLYIVWQSSNCPLAWSPDGEWVYYGNVHQVLALQFDGDGKVKLWEGRERIMWLLQSCPQTGRLLFRAGGRLVLCEPEGLERTLYRGDFFTLDATLAASKAVLWKKEDLILLDWSEGLERTLISSCPSDFAISPDGKKIACAEGCLRLFLNPAFTLLSSAPEAAAPSFSPDSQSLVFLNGDYELWRVNIDGTGLTRLAWVTEPIVTVSERRGSYACKPGWSSDGRFLVAQLTHATHCPTNEDARIEHASVIIDFQESRAEVWPGYHHHAIFRPTTGSPNFRWTAADMGSPVEPQL